MLNHHGQGEGRGKMLCVMEIKKAEQLRKKWGDKPCSHPSFEEETFPATKETEWLQTKTGDYVCLQCGRVFTKTEKEQFNKERR